MNEKMQQEKEPRRKGMREAVRAMAVAGTLLMSHGEARAFEIKPGSTFEQGMQEVRRGTRDDDFESIGFLAVESGMNGMQKYAWGGSERSTWSTGGFDPTSNQISSVLEGAVTESGRPFTVYLIHSHFSVMPIEGIDSSKKVYSVPPSAEDVIAMLMRAEAEEKPRHGSRSFAVSYAASDAAGVWFFNRDPANTVDRTPFAISFMLEGNNKTEDPIYRWIDANAIEGEKDAASIESHVKSLMSGELYSSLLEAYRNVGVNVRYVSWSDIDEDDFPVAQTEDK